MEGESIISWTPANWITVLIMVTLGFALLGAGAKFVQMKRANSAG